VAPEAQDVPERVERILSHLLARPVSRDEDGDRPLRELGLSSLRMIQLLGEIESVFGVRVLDAEVAAANFGTLDALVSFLGRKLGKDR
jgi:acyl carrier protein